MILPTSSTGKSYPDIKGYRIVQQIGGGGFSRVFRAINPKASVHKVAAVKVVSYAKPSSAASRQIHPPDRSALRKEVQIHQVLKHQHVLEFLEAEEYLKETSTNHVPGLYMVLEYGAGGDLFDKIAPDVGVMEDLAHVYFVQLMGALEYIHSQGVAHRDIKPENLLLDANGLLKLADFGLCSVYRYKGKERELKGACGSLPYIAPEMNGQPYRGEPADVWSTGVVLFALLVGNTPWDEPTRRSEEFMAYFEGQTYYPWTKIESDALSLLHGMLCVYPQKRFSISDIKKHKWYLRNNSLMPRGQDPDPASLAEGLLQGLIVSGDLTYQLHTDGKRADVPDHISLTQPEAFGPGLAFDSARLPPSSALPALKTSDPKKIAMSQQISARRNNVPSASIDGLGMAAGAASSQFTQAMNHMTQWSSLAGGVVRFSPHLTRVFCSGLADLVAKQIIGLLSNMSITHNVRPTRSDQDEDEFFVNDDPASSPIDPSTIGDDAMDLDMVSAYDEDPTVTSRGTAKKNLTNGCTIRVTTTDRRKCALRGEIIISPLSARNADQAQEGQQYGNTAKQAKTYVMMRRSKGDPLEWRRLFRALVMDEKIRPMIVS